MAIDIKTHGVDLFKGKLADAFSKTTDQNKHVSNIIYMLCQLQRTPDKQAELLNCLPLKLLKRVATRLSGYNGPMDTIPTERGEK